MTKHKQKSFVRELSRHIAEEVIGRIKQGAIPESWDGHELRCLLRDRHIESASMTIIKREPRSRRAREYRNLVLVRNL